MNELYIAAIGAAIYGVIREIGGQIVAVKKASNEVESATNEAYRKRTDLEIAELKADYELLKVRLNESEAKRIAEEIKNHECEKNTIRLEGKLDLLTKMFMRDLPADSKLHAVFPEEKPK